MVLQATKPLLGGSPEKILVRAFDNAMRWQKNCRLAAHVGNASDAGEMPIITKRGLKGVRASGAMRGFHNSFFDPQTLVLIEKAFDEAWLTLKSVGNKTVKPDELARSVLRLAMEGERDPARLHDGALEQLLPATNWREAS